MTMAPEPEFLRLLREQVGHEFDAHQQYVAIAVWFDSQDLPQLARHHYRQALEERNHAMMIVEGQRECARVRSRQCRGARVLLQHRAAAQRAPGALSLIHI